jgi:hypothetical protein
MYLSKHLILMGLIHLAMLIQMSGRRVVKFLLLIQMKLLTLWSLQLMQRKIQKIGTRVLNLEQTQMICIHVLKFPHWALILRTQMTDLTTTIQVLMQ